MNDSKQGFSRRHLLGRAAALPVMAGSLAAQAPERYRLGCMASMYSALPLADALARIRKIGYRYIAPSARHAGEAVFTPDVPGAERQRMLRRMKDLGVQPFLSLGGFGAEPVTDKGLAVYLAQLDLCADFGISVMVGGGPWYFQRFPNLPKRAADWEQEVARFYAGLEKAVRHAEAVHVTIALKPHTGITATAKACMEVVKRIVSERLQICWDAGNVSFYEGIYPDPDLPDLAPRVKAVCIKDHLGLRGDANFPVPGQGQVDHELMFRTLFSAGFNGPMAVERVDGRGGKEKMTPEGLDDRLSAAYKYLVSVLDRVAARA
jgi:sugar phosphate isomerase/epimerase